jgi:hypothetical protein
VVSLKKLNLKSVFIVTLQLQESDAATVLNRPSSFGSQQTCTKNNLFKQKTIGISLGLGPENGQQQREKYRQQD